MTRTGKDQLDLIRLHVVCLGMMNATETIKQARDLQQRLAQAGQEVSIRDAYMLARIGQRAGVLTDLEIARQQRNDRVMQGMVAGHISDMRACGAWDGE